MSLFVISTFQSILTLCSILLGYLIFNRLTYFYCLNYVWTVFLLLLSCLLYKSQPKHFRSRFLWLLLLFPVLLPCLCLNPPLVYICPFWICFTIRCVLCISVHKILPLFHNFFLWRRIHLWCLFIFFSYESNCNDSLRN